MKWILALLFSTLVYAALLDAQVNARQGDPSTSPLQQFQSPMVLDLPLPDLGQLSLGKGFTFREVPKFYCEDVVVSQLVMTKLKNREKPGGFSLEFRGFVSVRASYDRWTTLRFDLLRGQKRIATMGIPRMDTEESRTTPFVKDLKLDASQVERLFAPEDSKPSLRVTVTVENNS